MFSIFIEKLLPNRKNGDSEGIVKINFYPRWVHFANLKIKTINKNIIGLGNSFLLQLESIAAAIKLKMWSEKLLGHLHHYTKYIKFYQLVVFKISCHN
jgi:hypothetical protein